MVIYKLGDLTTNIILGGDIPKIKSMVKIDDFKVPIVSNGTGLNSIRAYCNIPKTSKNVISISAIGTIGHIQFWNNPILPVYGLLTIQANQKYVFNKFLFYKLKNTNLISSGSVQKYLLKKDVLKTKLEIPSLKNQKQIIDIIEPLEKMSNSIESYIKSIKNTLIDKYTLLTNETIPFNKSFKLLNKKWTNEKSYFATNGFKELKLDTSKIIDIQKTRPSRANLLPSPNSCIISKLDGENKVYIFKQSPHFVVSTGFYNFETKYKDHLLGFMLSNDFKKQKTQYSTGTTMQGITLKGLENIKIKKTTDEGRVFWDLLIELNKINNQLINYKNKLIKLLIK